MVWYGVVWYGMVCCWVVWEGKGEEKGMVGIRVLVSEWVSE